ncbi:MlrC [Cryobacterium sp. MLB-32]|uniref:M81 family metallopeptidase n=1 Tax=Cryobacterium sp. MLB-32 TaxID=1529318 RepID=UPI0004E72845|nr:M81 family metallopeptidase [Cryobacterium sp. MLB-32]KFF59239.1 MlrC [Cryobacterium sp. MLB-32]
MSPRRRFRVAIAGLGTESSTFSPATTNIEAFRTLRGSEVLDDHEWLAPGSPLRARADWLPTLVATALAGGAVTREAYDRLTAEILTRLADVGPLDGLYLDIHGAMSVQGLADPEAHLLEAIRAVIGPDVLVSASMDLHGNVSRRLVHQLDLVTCGRLAPHEDSAETHERAARNLLDRLDSGLGRPLKAWVPIPVLLAGEKTSTRVEPGRGVYAQVAEVESMAGVLDAALWVGYAWADEPRNRAVAVVTGDDAGAVASGARRLARSYWDSRNDFDFAAPTGSLDECLDAALASPARPFFISDSGDNPTAGGAGDVTWGLARLLERPELRVGAVTVIYASIPDPAAVAAAVEAGVGGQVRVEAGAQIDSRHAGPVLLEGVVRFIRHGDEDAGTEVVIQVGGVHVIVTTRRKPYHLEADFTRLGLQPRSADVVVVKIGYLEPELFEMSADWRLALTPGGVDQDLARLGHQHLRRPMFPFDAFEWQPDLEPRFIAPSTGPLTGPDE